MSTEILINVAPQEIRVALVEQGLLQELFLERVRETSVAGNIYLGRVVRVLPGMQAAFVEIGLDKAAFLYAGDVFKEREESIDWEERYPARSEHASGPRAIESLVRTGEEILVQISKEPLGTKGARVTSQITLPGRYLVYMPGFDHVGVSRRIEEAEERTRLTSMVDEIREPGDGYIVRTVSEGADRAEIESDMRYLKTLWRRVQAEREQAAAPALLYKELNLAMRALRDLADEEVHRIRVDSPQVHEEARRFIQAFMPHYAPCLELHMGSRPLFDHDGVEEEIRRALSRKVGLKSGGSIVIEHTEALTAIDVNTGSYVGARNLEETILKNNLEAAREIARQLRLRNVGGLIVVDFIDMAEPENRETLFQTFSRLLAADRSKVNLLEISRLGLLEMTRKRNRESLEQLLCEPCPHCGGQGVVKTVETVCCEIFRETLREVREFPAASSKLTILAAPEVVDKLMTEEGEAVSWLSSHLGKEVDIRADPSLHREKFEVVLY